MERKTVKTILMAASTLCGRISPGVIGSSEDRRFLEQMRHETDASLVGAGTLRDGDPEMRGAGGVLFGNRVRAVVSGSGDFPWKGKKIFQKGPPPIIFTSETAAAFLRRRLKGKAEIIALPPGPHGLSMIAAFEVLRERGVRSLLLEGGGRLNYTCLAEDLVDEILLTLSPRLSGERYGASLVEGPVFLGDPFLDLQLLSVKQEETGELFLHYKVLKRSN